jgi:hypothetical protein
MTVNKGYPLAPQTLPNEKEHRRLIAQTANLAMQGKLNAVTQVTLTASSTTTTLTDARIGANTGIFFSPLTADAAAALGGLYVSAQQKGQATLTHASTASVDRTFNVLLIG